MTNERLFPVCSAIACAWLCACSSGEQYEKKDPLVRAPVQTSRPRSRMPVGPKAPVDDSVPLNLTPESASKAFCLPGVFKSLAEAGVTRPKSADQYQQWFLDAYSKGAVTDLPQYSDNLQVMTADSHDEIAAWFTGRGFPTTAKELPADYQAVGAIFDLHVNWKARATERTIYFPLPNQGGDIRYEGVRMTDEFEIFNLIGHEHPLISIPTDQPGWTVYLVKAGKDENPDPAFLPARAKELMELPRTPSPMKIIIFPVIRMAGDIDVSWLAGMSGIGSAEQKIRFRFNAQGRFPEKILEVIDPQVDTRPVTYLILRRFYFILAHSKMTYPAFVALSASDSWVVF
jgi:hypothetical protein